MPDASSAQPSRRRRIPTPLPALLPKRRVRPLSEARRRCLDDVLARDAHAAGTVGVLPALFVQAALPHRRLHDADGAEAPVHVVRNGALTVTLRAGYCSTGDGAPRCLGVPYGGVGRLVLAHVCTTALRRRSRLVPLGRSFAAFLRTLDVPGSGGAHGRLAYVRDALLRLGHLVVSCERTRNTPTRSDEVVTHALLAERLHLWRTFAPDDTDGAAVEEHGTIRLSDAFFAQLQAHAVPVDLRKLHLLRHAPLALDLYAWATHRAYGLVRTRQSFCVVALTDLQAQLGSPYACPAEFARHARDAFALVRALWPALRADLPRGRVVLHAGPPDVTPHRSR